MRERLAADVAAALRSTAAVDATGRWHSASGVTGQLAVKLVEGAQSLAGFVAAVRAARGTMAPPAASLDEISAAWGLARVGLEELISAVFGDSSDAGIRAISNYVGDVARAQQLSPERLRTWVERVLEDWSDELRDFRMGGATPSLQRCVDKNQSYIAFTVMTAAVASDVLHSSRKRQRGRRGGAAFASGSEEDSEFEEEGSERGEGS